MLINILRELDIETHPIIISTRKNGIINPAQNMLDKFNHVIAHATIDGKVYLMDDTDNHTPWFLLPEKCLNGEGRLVHEALGKWVNLELSRENMNKIYSTIKVKPCGSMEVNRQQEFTNYQRLNMQATLRAHSREEDYINQFESARQGIEVSVFSVENKDEWKLPLIANYVIEANSADSQPKDVIYVNPLLFDRLSSNPFRLENRQFPVDFVYPSKTSYIIKIEIPEGYIVDELPEGKSFGLPQNAALFSVNYSRNNAEGIDVAVDVEIGKPLFVISEYAALRGFYAQLVEEQARNIVLKKM